MTLSEQARADARCDADTLRAYGLRTWQVKTYEDIECGGAAAALYMKSKQTTLRSVEAYKVAMIAARAAFRAVPGLRGEDTSSKGGTR